ncbi:hypothetical protein GJ744_006981 [Endocarpon pusillum]|uniref:Uncharacterized protein n=1 Tax=Endocarpon pusillum TaxID=364733 RepID=A0A8H7A6B3_9EURO|nr:hypothetical protein GJ744_006981 [Endocarpon pusillum]
MVGGPNPEEIPTVGVPGTPATPTTRDVVAAHRLLQPKIPWLKKQMGRTRAAAAAPATPATGKKRARKTNGDQKSSAADDAKPDSEGVLVQGGIVLYCFSAFAAALLRPRGRGHFLLAATVTYVTWARARPHGKPSAGTLCRIGTRAGAAERTTPISLCSSSIVARDQPTQSYQSYIAYP